MATLDGTTLKVSADTLASYTDALYAGATWTADACSMREVPPLKRVWSAITNTKVCNPEQEDRKGSSKYDNVTMTMERDNDNAAHAILEAGEADKNDYLFALTFPNGDIAYFAGQVGEFSTTDGGGIDTFNDRTLTIFVSASSLVYVEAS